MPDNYFYFRETILLLTQTKPEVIKPFPRSTQPNTTFIMLINVKMPTIVGSLTYYHDKHIILDYKARDLWYSGLALGSISLSFPLGR